MNTQFIFGTGHFKTDISQNKTVTSQFKFYQDKRTHLSR